MTYIEYMKQLWRSSELSPMPASEIALYAYIVHECNKRYWKMPLVCSTTKICGDLCMSRQTVITARRHLAERKLIAFTDGKSRHLLSNYTILKLTDDLTVDLTHIKDKDKDYYIKESNEKFDTKNKREYGFSKEKKNRRLCPAPSEGADYDSAF